MATPNEQGEPPVEESPADESSVDESARTPPRRLPGAALWRAFLIVAVFVFASSLLMMVTGVGTETWFGWWTELLVVPGFFLGVLVAIGDYLWQRSRAR